MWSWLTVFFRGLMWGGFFALIMVPLVLIFMPAGLVSSDGLIWLAVLALFVMAGASVADFLFPK